MADPRRSRCRLPDGRAFQVGRSRLHAHLGQDSRHRALPHQPVRLDVRRDHGLEPGQDRHRGQGAAGHALSHQPGRLRDPQRRARGAPRRAVRDAHAHAQRRGGVGTKGRRPADLAVLDLRAREPRLSRLRRRRPARRGEAAAGRRPRQQDLPDAAQPRASDGRQDDRGGVRGHVRLRDDLCGTDPRPGGRRARLGRADRDRRRRSEHERRAGTDGDPQHRSGRARLARLAASPRSPRRQLAPLMATRPRHSAATPKAAARPRGTGARTPEECILVLQGGGALGAYQAGVFETLAAMRQTPDWVAGISIGAINAALIAGNVPERRVERLREFWESVSSFPFAPPPLPAEMHRLDGARDAVNETNATIAMLFGVSGFFSPRVPAAPFQTPGTPAAISYYDTEPLKKTLERLVDFDLLNSGRVRLSVGAVDVTSGNFKYFDTDDRRHPLDARHIMASGALPPGFPPIEIDGAFYWDGGIVSNTPLQYVLDQPGRRRRLVFQVDLFAARGEMPATLAEANEREKDIRFSSRTRLNTSFELRRQATLQAAKRLVAKLPANLRDDPDARALAALPAEAAVSVVHLIYRSKHYESQSKDYEFSRASMLEHWSAGMADTQGTLDDPARQQDRYPDHH